MKYLINDNLVSVVLNGKIHQIDKLSGFYDRAIEAIKVGGKKGEQQIQVIVDKISALKNYVEKPKNVGKSQGDEYPQVVGNTVQYKGEVVNNAVCNTIFSFMEKGLPFDPLLKFLGKLLENPSRRSVEQLYGFIEKHNLVLDTDGDIIFWKAVTKDFKDKHTGTLDNSPGQVVTVQRNQVSDDPNHACHFGLHCGNYEYVKGFGSEWNGDRFVMVKVVPTDVVCIPYDCSYQKLRVCRYEVLEEVQREDVVAFDNSLKETKKKDVVKATSVTNSSYTKVTAPAKLSNEDKIFAKVAKVISRLDGRPVSSLKFSSALFDKTPSKFNLISSIENEFDISYVSTDVYNFKTIRELVKYLKNEEGVVVK